MAPEYNDTKSSKVLCPNIDYDHVKCVPFRIHRERERERERERAVNIHYMMHMAAFHWHYRSYYYRPLNGVIDLCPHKKLNDSHDFLYYKLNHY
jgi:hypothetical protein